MTHSFKGYTHHSEDGGVIETQHYSLKTGLEDYKRLSILNKYYNPGSRELLRKANLHPLANILDIGCGHGEMTRIIAQ